MDTKYQTVHVHISEGKTIEFTVKDKTKKLDPDAYLIPCITLDCTLQIMLSVLGENIVLTEFNENFWTFWTAWVDNESLY